MAAGAVITLPFCGACGYDNSQEELHDDGTCDSCGADFEYSGGAGILAPAAAVGTPGVGTVSFAFTVVPAADSTESSVSDDGLASWSVFAADTSPTVVSATTGTVVGIRVRSVLNGVKGAYVEATDTTG